MLFNIIILSIIEGVTEFLPVSSTGHLLLVSQWLNMDKAFYEVFDIAIQFGAIVAVLCLYPRYFKLILSKDLWSKRIIVILAAILPIYILGYIGRDFIKTILFTSYVIYSGLIVGGIALIFADIFYKKTSLVDNTEKISIKSALIIGLCQCLALWPGMSRSAVTIIGGLCVGLNKLTAASFSFIIAVPVIGTVVGYDLLRVRSVLSIEQYLWIGLGMLLSFVIAFITMKWFLAIIQTKCLYLFGIYRIILGSIGLLFLL